MADSTGLPAPVVAAILGAAAAALPEEACGVLLGSVAAGATRVTDQRAVPNEAADNTRAWAIPAHRMHDLQREAAALGGDIVGFWHSHPNGPGAPSLTDLEGALPGYLYVIVDVRTGMISAWRLRDDRRAFEPVDC